MNVKIDYASINDDEPLKLRPKRDDMDDEDDDDDTSDADSGSEASDNNDMDDPDGNDTDDADTSDDESAKVEEDDDDDGNGGNNNDNDNDEGDGDADANANDDDDDNQDGDTHEDDYDDDRLGDAEDDDDDNDDEEESRYRKINQDFRRNYITETHPETSTHTEDEIHALAKVVRNKLGTIVDPLHRTVPILTKYEKTRILGIRTKQLNNGAEPFISSKINITSDKIIDGYPIALKELEEKKLPFIIRRPLPGGGVEYWYLQDLEVL